MTKIKICGLRREEDIRFANIVKPDYIGYVFADSSRRYISPECAQGLTKLLDPSIIPVGVFVNAPADLITSLVKSGVISIAQLHGDEDEAFIRRLKADGVEVIKAFKVSDAFVASEAENSPADHILLDSGSGSGKTFDWSLISRVNRKFFLAGGLDAGNVASAVRRICPYAVDASSSLESDGFKDLQKMTAFTREVREALA